MKTCYRQAALPPLRDPEAPLPRLISRMKLARLHTNKSAVLIAVFSLFDGPPSPAVASFTAFKREGWRQCCS